VRGLSDDLPRRQFLQGDAAKQLRTLPEASIDCVITSPPYWAQRDYGMAGQIGAEPSVQGWVTELVGVAAELRRVLKPTGALWLNVGDGYSRHAGEGARRKSLLLGPQRLAVALQEDGWLVRNHVIWAKRNPMPHSVTDRLSCSHETMLLLTTQPSYYFDLDAIRVPATTALHSGRSSGRAVYPPPTAVPHVQGSPRVDLNRGLAGLKAAGQESHPLGKNPGDVWQLSTATYRGAHFAVFPPELVRRPLLATCPERLCTACDAPWRRARQRIYGRLLAVGALRPGCGCNANWRPGVVLDPFMGTGTVALVAERERRDWLGIELNPTYIQLAETRLNHARAQP
jgi:site-specific DNA-methyltransferase (adenine-specific)